jgi:hypothetical protein
MTLHLFLLSSLVFLVVYSESIPFFIFTWFSFLFVHFLIASTQDQAYPAWCLYRRHYYREEAGSYEEFKRDFAKRFKDLGEILSPWDQNHSGPNEREIILGSDCLPQKNDPGVRTAGRIPFTNENSNDRVLWDLRIIVVALTTEPKVRE